MKNVKWVLLTLGCAAVLLAVLLTGCVADRPRQVGHAPPLDNAEGGSGEPESITTFPDLKDRGNERPQSASPQSVVLAWDASPTSGVAYYRIHFGTNGANYSFVTNAGLGLMQTVILPHHDRWFFAVTAVDVNGLESLNSDQVQMEYQSHESRTGEKSQTTVQAR